MTGKPAYPCSSGGVCKVPTAYLSQIVYDAMNKPVTSAKATVLARGDDPPEPPAVLARGWLPGGGVAGRPGSPIATTPPMIAAMPTVVTRPGRSLSSTTPPTAASRAPEPRPIG